MSTGISQLRFVQELSDFTRRHRKAILGLLFLGVVGSLAPLSLGKYTINSVLDLFLLYVIVAESYDVLGGLMGYVNLGIIVYYGAGAYVYAILYHVLSWNSLDALAVAALVSALLGFLSSFPMFRLKGFYFAVATLALVPLGFYMVESPNLQQWTNGVGGINFVPLNYVESYYVILGFALFSILIVYAISHSRLGLALTSIREDEEIAEATGINTRLVKKVALTISASMAGFTGALFALSQGTVLPGSVFSLSLAFIPVTFAMFGGTGTVIGPIVGSGVYIILDATLHSSFIARSSSVQWLSYYESAIEGIFLIVVGLFAPDGIMGLVSRSYSRLKRTKSEAEAEAKREIAK